LVVVNLFVSDVYLSYLGRRGDGRGCQRSTTRLIKQSRLHWCGNWEWTRGWRFTEEGPVFRDVLHSATFDRL